MTRTKASASEQLTEAVRMLAQLTRMVEQACQEGGLSLPQYRLLLYIRHVPRRAGEVASKTAVSRPALTGLVDGLEKRGLLRRLAVAGDRRGIRLELTEGGEQALATAERSLVTRLSELEQRTGEPGLVGALAAMRESLRAQSEDRRPSP